jgi:hypothetical protein
LQLTWFNKAQKAKAPPVGAGGAVRIKKNTNDPDCHACCLPSKANRTALEVLIEAGSLLEMDEEAIGTEAENMESGAVPAYRAAVLMYRANGNKLMLEKQIRRVLEKVQKMRTELAGEDDSLGKNISTRHVWKEIRGMVVAVVTSSYWDILLFFVIVSNMVVIAITRPNVGPETETEMEPFDELMEVIDHCYTAFYTAEVRPPATCRPIGLRSDPIRCVVSPLDTRTAV